MILKYFRQISTFFDIILMYKRMNWDADRRVAELREGRRTECVAQLAIYQGFKACAYVKGLPHQTVSPLYMADVGI